MVYPALLPLMRRARLPVVDWTDAPTDLNGLVLFAERRNLVSARVPSHFKRSLRRSIYKTFVFPLPRFPAFCSLVIDKSSRCNVWLKPEGNFACSVLGFNFAVTPNILYLDSTHVVSRYNDLGYFISINSGPLNVPTPLHMIGTAKDINNINTTSLWEISNTKCERPNLCFDPIFHLILVFGRVCVNLTHACPPGDRWMNMEYSLDKHYLATEENL
jgi:hypothetical protein